MKIYTKTGDGGETSLFGGGRVAKDDARVEAYGAVDELNAALGLARALAPGSEIDGDLARIQAELFCGGGGAGHAARARAHGTIPSVRPGWAEALERQMDRWDEALPPLTAFVLPGGRAQAAALHVARATCRRAERRAVAALPPGAHRPGGGGLPEPALRLPLRGRTVREPPRRRGRDPLAAAEGALRWLPARRVALVTGAGTRVGRAIARRPRAARLAGGGPLPRPPPAAQSLLGDPRRPRHARRARARSRGPSASASTGSTCS